MLATITHATHFLAMTISLWMAFYLFARGFPNRVTLRAVLALLAIAIFFLDTYNHYYTPQTNTNPLRAALLVIALICWYSTTFTLLAPKTKARFRWMEITVYLLGISSVILLMFAKSSAIQDVNILYTAELESNFINILYGTTQITAVMGVLFNLTIQDRVRRTTEGKYYFIASMFLGLAFIYGILSLVIESIFPRVVEDGLVFGCIFLLGISVARHQSMVERRTIWQDFPIAMLGMTGIVAFYMAVCYWFGVPNHLLGTIAALVITTHSMFDLGREAVERWRKLEEDRFRQKSLFAKKLGDETLGSYLDEELALLLKTLNASGGLIATKREDKLIVAASHYSLPPNSEIPELSIPSESLSRVEDAIAGLAWVSQAFEGMDPVALVGIGPPNAKLKYSTGDLELLDEFTDQIGTLISISSSRNNKIQPAVSRVVESLALPPEAEWVKMVDDGLRRYGDFVSLGQSPLADWTGVNGLSHIERGKQMQRALHEAIQSLRPEGERPPEPLPREWYSHVVLHDAYVKGVPNREVMARLYVSEGTFHRIRRHAVRGVARYLAEKKRLES